MKSDTNRFTDRRIRNMVKDKIDSLKELADSGIKIEPSTFESILSKDINRRLKRVYAFRFLMWTVIFTFISYAIVLLNSPLNLNIPKTEMTALIIEMPIQFVGILYIVARNLFPLEK